MNVIKMSLKSVGVNKILFFIIQIKHLGRGKKQIHVVAGMQQQIKRLSAASTVISSAEILELMA
jgi:cell division protein FtsB